MTKKAFTLIFATALLCSFSAAQIAAQSAPVQPGWLVAYGTLYQRLPTAPVSDYFASGYSSSDFLPYGYTKCENGTAIFHAKYLRTFQFQAAPQTPPPISVTYPPYFPPAPTPQPTATPTPTPTSTPTPTPSPTPTPTATPTPSPTPSPSPTPTPTPSPSPPPSPTPTSTPRPSSTPTPSPLFVTHAFFVRVNHDGFEPDFFQVNRGDNVQFLATTDSPGSSFDMTLPQLGITFIVNSNSTDSPDQLVFTARHSGSFLITCPKCSGQQAAIGQVATNATLQVV